MNKDAGKFFRHPLTLVLGCILTVVCTCVIISSKERRRRVPENYIWLAGMTLGEASFLAAVCADLTEFSVFAAIMATCCSVVGLFGAALYASSAVDKDKLIKTMFYGLIGALIMQFIILLSILIASPFDNKFIIFWFSIWMCVVSGGWVMFALLFIILPGVEDKDDYILGAMRLYLEIARLFFWLLKAMGKKK